MDFDGLPIYEKIKLTKQNIIDERKQIGDLYPKNTYINTDYLLEILNYVEYLEKTIKKRDIQLKYHTERTSYYAKEFIKFERELRNLMDLYIKRKDKLYKEIEEAKRDGDVDGELTGKVLYKQMRIVIAELFQTMKKIGVLDDEEIEFGDIKEVASK